MVGYQTEQRRALIAFFEAHPDTDYTVDETVKALKDTLGTDAPSRSTVYRTISNLEKENALSRTYRKDTRRSAYRYHDAKACATHLHIRCVSCNKLTHLDAAVSDMVAKLLYKNARIALDVSDTILTGCCEDCIGK